MLRFSLVCLTAFFMSHAFADEDIKKEATAVPKTEVDTNEAIVHQHSLATHMGWSDQQAVFRAPRNFRQKELNEISPDSLEASKEDITN